MNREGDAAGGNFRKRDGEKYWAPMVEMDSERSALRGAGARDWYAVVDDVGDGVARLAIAGWPRLDRSSNLLFDRVYDHVYQLPELQRVVNKARASNRQPDPNRHLRVGDAFWIRSGARPGKDLVEFGFEGLILDITGAAREQARVAMCSELCFSDPPEA